MNEFENPTAANENKRVEMIVAKVNGWLKIAYRNPEFATKLDFIKADMNSPVPHPEAQEYLATVVNQIRVLLPKEHEGMEDGKIAAAIKNALELGLY